MGQHSSLLHSLKTKRRNFEGLTKFKADSNEYPCYSDLKKFLLSRTNASEANVTKPKPLYHQTPQSHKEKASTFIPKSAFSAQINRLCVYYNRSSHLIECTEFCSLSPQKRFEVIHNAHFCLNCFNSKHSSNNCQNHFVKYVKESTIRYGILYFQILSRKLCHIRKQPLRKIEKSSRCSKRHSRNYRTKKLFRRCTCEKNM